MDYRSGPILDCIKDFFSQALLNPENCHTSVEGTRMETPSRSRFDHDKQECDAVHSKVYLRRIIVDWKIRFYMDENLADW